MPLSKWTQLRLQSRTEHAREGASQQQVRQYDPSTGSGEPIRKEHHYRVFVGSRQIAEIVKPEVNGVIVADEVTTRYLHQDHLGSSVLATDEAGNVEYRQEFDAFGSIRSGGTWNYDNANSGFTGHQHDNELQLINMRGRLYDPKIGRFTKADPFVTDPWSAAGLNRYSYVRNSPLNYVDPSGFENIFSAAWHYLFGGGEDTEVRDRNGGGMDYPREAPPIDMGDGGASTRRNGPADCLTCGGGSRATPARSAPSAVAPAQAPRASAPSLAAPSENIQGLAAASPQGGGFINSGDMPMSQSWDGESGGASGRGTPPGAEGQSGSGRAIPQCNGDCQYLGDVALYGIPIPVGRVLKIAGPAATAALRAVDLGLSGSGLAKLVGTVVNAGTTRIINVGYIEAVTRGALASQARGALPRILNAARAEGIQTLQINATFANAELQQFVTSMAARLGGTFSSVGGIDTFTFILR